MTSLFDIPLTSRLSREEAYQLVDLNETDELLRTAARRRDAAHGDAITYSPKVFIPLTQLCRDVCHYCTFAHAPREGVKPYLSIEEAVAIAEAGKRAGCHEALFTLGDKPELRYRSAREELKRLNHESTLSYVAEVARAVFERTGLLPHINPGIMSA
ncbi:MAG: radical SAM protein, partial [Afipia sp.]|nr:radical SAM protein [Afipia sp.]